MSDFRQSRDEVPETTGGNYLPCRYCGKATLKETLSQYGARCQSCFDKYCAMTPAEIKAEYERGLKASNARHRVA